MMWTERGTIFVVISCGCCGILHHCQEVNVCVCVRVHVHVFVCVCVSSTIMFWDIRQPSQRRPTNASKAIIDTGNPYGYLDLQWKPFLKVRTVHIHTPMHMYTHLCMLAKCIYTYVLHTHNVHTSHTHTHTHKHTQHTHMYVLVMSHNY